VTPALDGVPDARHVERLVSNAVTRAAADRALGDETALEEATHPTRRAPQVDGVPHGDERHDLQLFSVQTLHLPSRRGFASKPVRAPDFVGSVSTL